MAVPPKLAGTILPIALNKPHAKHTVELYVDYVCPFSAKLFKTIFHTVLPKISNSQHYTNNLQIILRPQIQSWHPTSTLTTESALAILKVAPDSFWQYSAALFDKQKEYFDIPTVNETRNDTYKRLAKLAKESVGANEEELYDLLKIPEKGDEGALNAGNGVTNDIKRIVKVWSHDRRGLDALEAVMVR
ncbi:putative thioredoxin-like protein [Phaeomoniella chlamydospora]|uniref:Putative thioredoxin-like protein n=1 Tax=Phaeomoniella chlamydospora TaxID=158046 RepID=A0A0G2EUX3_PHACM|nr:putative thioredoxin-like protein [Phaeomoniella chlamydospora]